MSAGHAAPLSGGWSVWRWAALRSAGLPVDGLLALASPAAAAAADHCLAAEDALARARDAALAALPGGEEARRLRRRLRQGGPPPAPDAGGPHCRPALLALAEADVAAGAARAEYTAAFAAGLTDTTAALHRAAADPLFREAVTWQNRHALRTGVDVLLRHAGERTSKHRGKEALVTSYLQRYAAKNDTIGFFGPVGWARIEDAGPPIRVRPGRGLLAARSVHLEGWAVDALAEAIAADGRLRHWLVPRRLPHVHLEGRTLRVPLTPPLPLPAAHAAVLQACDGVRPARELARELVAAGVPDLDGEAAVYDALEALRAARRLAWTLEVPAEGLGAERSLRRLLERVDDVGLRAAALERLDELEAARDAVGAAAGDPGRLDAAMADLERTFVRLTGTEATRHAGRTYAGRTLAYEDCRRDVDVRLGPAALASLGAPLALVLASARWFTHEAAVRHRAAFREIHARLAARGGSQAVPLSGLWLHAHPLLFGDGSPLVAGLERDLQDRWARVLALPAGARRVRLSADALRPAVEAAFAAPHSGWPSARHHSPDLLLAARSERAIANGDFEWVLGEVHPALNTLRAAFFVDQHPRPEELRAALASDLPSPRVWLVATRELGGATLRTSNGLVMEDDLRLVFAHDTCGVPPDRALPLGSLVVEPAGGELVVRDPTGRRLEVMALLGELVMFQLVQHFRPLAPAYHVPRVSVDRLVLARESWRVPAGSLGFVAVEDEAARFLAARRWTRELGLPRCCFVRLPTETKPFYVDLDAPLSIDVLARAVRRAAAAAGGDAPVTVTEMLPGPDRAWLTDAEGRRYTSELRLVAVDEAQCVD